MATLKVVECRFFGSGSELLEHFDNREPKTVSKSELARDEFWCTLRDAPQVMGVGYEQYVRALLSQGKIEGIRVQWKHYTKWFLFVPSLLNRPRRRTDRRKFLLYINPDHESEIRKALQASGLQFELTVAYQSKDTD